MINLVKSKIKESILKKEIRLAQEDDLFKWSTKGPWQASPNLAELQKWSSRQVQNPEFLFPKFDPKFELSKNGKLTFQSGHLSAWPENNLVVADYFKAPKSKAAVLILGHWNSSRPTYNQLAKLYKMAGISALRLSLPYHDERRPASMPIATGMLSADLNQTIDGIRQACTDAQACVEWLAQEGHQEIAVIGASMGSSVSLLLACHEPRLKAMLGYLSAADTADLIWRSSATVHLRESFEGALTLDDLRQSWSCISPISYLHKLAARPFKVHIGWAKYDTVCPPDLTRRMLERLKAENVEVSESVYRCGHNTLATAPFIHMSGLKGLAFLRGELLGPNSPSKSKSLHR